MIIPINKEYRLESDSTGWSVCKSGEVKKTKEIKWSPIAYYPTFEGVTRKVRELMILTADIEGVEAALAHIKHVDSILYQALSQK